MSLDASIGTSLGSKRSHRLRDYVLYLAISFAVIGAVLFLGLSQDHSNKPMKWFFFLFYTGVVFGSVIEKNGVLWKRRSFWLLTGSLLLLHCTILALILAHTQHLKAVSWIPGYIEIVVLMHSIRWLFRPDSSTR